MMGDLERERESKQERKKRRENKYEKNIQSYKYNINHHKTVTTIQ
jgi:hypothetical protein